MGKKKINTYLWHGHRVYSWGRCVQNSGGNHVSNALDESCKRCGVAPPSEYTLVDKGDETPKRWE